jgi:alkylation response protein AidB-like acyl-CoA dehydrogenase
VNFNLTENQINFQAAARDFAAKEFVPHASTWDREKSFPREAIRKAGNMGFCGVYTNEDVGGLGLSRLDASIIFEELAVGCPSTTAYITIHNMVTWMIDRFGSDQLRHRFCPELATGRKLGSYCLTEPWSGSDAASLKATARKQGNYYVLNGTKAFVSGAGESQVLVVMARTGDQTPKGISSFVVPADLGGISFGENERKMGWNSQSTRIVNFDHVVIPLENLLAEEGTGFKIAMSGLDGGRVNIATCSVGAAQAALSLTQKYMLEREQFGKPLAHFQALQFKIADMVTELVASRQMVRLAASKLDHKDPQATTYCAMAKRLATDMCFNVCNQAIQIFGGYGYSQDYPLERLMRDTRVHQILEGTNEIMRVIISRKILEEGATLALR